MSESVDESTPLVEQEAQSRPQNDSAMVFWSLGCLYGASAVALGAFGAHGRKWEPSKAANWRTASQYQLIHSGVLLLATAAAPQNKLAAGLLTAGMTMFSGSIYLLTLDSQRFKFLGPVTPLGGLCLIGGWVALAVGSRGRLIAR